MSERIEALMRIVVWVISGFILGLWTTVVGIITPFHWLYVVITGKRNKKVAEFCHDCAHEVYRFYRYIVFHTNKRPFPFEELHPAKEKKNYE